MAAPKAKLIGGKRLFLRLTDAEPFGEFTEEMRLPKLTSLPDNKVSKPAWLPTNFTVTPPDNLDPRLERAARMMLAK